MDIKILDHVETTSSYKDGEVIFQLIAPKIKAGDQVTVSFEGIPSVPSAFINAALIRLLEEVPFEVIKDSLRITNSTKHINELINNRFSFASKFAKH